jgi:hypothetical protein
MNRREPSPVQMSLAEALNGLIAEARVGGMSDLDIAATLSVAARRTILQTQEPLLLLALMQVDMREVATMIAAEFDRRRR